MNPKKRILYIEDNLPDVRLLKAMLQEAHMLVEMDSAVQLNEGIAKLRESAYDALLLDLGLPDSQGFEGLYQISRTFPNLPIIVLTGQNDEQVGMNAIHDGAQDFLVKGSVTGEMLARTIRYAIERKQSEQKQRHIANVLSAIREINRMITRTKNPKKLAQDVCKILIKTNGYNGAWIALMNPSGEFETFVQSGYENKFQEFEQRIFSGDLSNCIQNTFVKSKVTLIENQQEYCRNCILMEEDSRDVVIQTRLEYGGKLYGMLSVCLSPNYGRRQEEPMLIEEMADDIALTLHNISLEEQKEASEREILDTLECITDALVSMNNDMEIIYYNNAAEILLMKKVPEVVGMPFFEVFPEMRNSIFEKKFRLAIKKKTPIIFEKYFDVPPYKNWYEVRVYPRQNGISVYLLVTTERKQEEARLEQFNIELESQVKKRTIELEKARSTAVDLMHKEAKLRQKAEKISDELKLSQIELEHAKDVAESASRAKSQFLANMSHEIRTPMNAITGITHLLENTPLSARQMDHVRKIKSATKNLLGVINDILDMSKIEAGKIQIDLVPFELNEVLHNLINMVYLKAQQKGVELILSTAPEVPKRLIGDPLRLEQILLNLIGNAIKFTEQGEILISISVEKRQEKNVILKFQVRDTGIGMSRSQIKKLFQPFSQTDGSITRRYGGTGLGLAISKRLIQMMQGDIKVQSKLGKGSLFTFTVALKEIEQEKSFSRILKKKKTFSVLVVDDNRTLLDVLIAYLTYFKCHVRSAMNGEDALNLLRNQNEKFDLMLIDWRMPGKDGLSIIREIQKDKTISDKPQMVLMTAYDQNKIILEAEKIGIDHVLAKPITRSILLDTIMRTLDEVSYVKQHPLNRQKAKPSTNKLKNIRILLVEDNEINRDMAREILEGEGVIVETAAQGQEAVQKLKAKLFDLVLMDLQMPEMDGYSATRLIRKLKNSNGSIPVIAMSADVVGSVRKKCHEAGMNDYLSKPIIVDALFRMLNKWIDKPPDQNKIDIRPKLTISGASVSHTFFDALSDCAGINISDGLERVNQNKILYQKLIFRFFETNQEFIQELDEAIYNKNWEKALKLTHTMKGVAGNLGFSALFDTVSLMNDTLKTRQIKKIKSVYSELSERLQYVLSVINKLREVVPSSHDVEQIPDHFTFQSKWQELLKLTKDSDTRALACFQEIKSVLSAKIPLAQIEILSQAIGQYDFETAISLLARINPSFEKEKQETLIEKR